jgi:hypothetical protein
MSEELESVAEGEGDDRLMELGSAIQEEYMKVRTLLAAWPRIDTKKL